MKFKHLIHIGLILICSFPSLLKAQLSEHATSHLINKGQLQRQVIISDTIGLPLWDDFTQRQTKVDTTLWEAYKQVNFNNGLSYLPPSLNTATLDAYDQLGNAYSQSTDAIGIGDSLVSKRIDLSNNDISDNIVLSYFWQEGYDFTAPDSEDSLRLFFKDTADVWIQVQSYGGSGSIQAIPFQQAFENLTNERYFHAGFQFKFEYFGNLAGDFDIWNLDYIYLNAGNTSVSTTNFAYDSYEDRTFSKLNKSLFNDYYAIPFKHLDEDFFDNNLDNMQLIYNNLWAGDGVSSLFATEIFGIIKDNDALSGIIDSLSVRGNFLTNAQDTALFTVRPQSNTALRDYILAFKDTRDSLSISVQLNLGNTDSLFFETINGSTVYYPEYDLKTNDTIQQTLYLKDYYALDDGSAESSIQLNSKNYQLAQEFILNKADYLTAIDIYVPNKAQNSGSQNITFIVLESLNQTGNNEEVLAAQNVLLQSSDGLNQFKRYFFEKPVFVEDTVFVGYREENDEVVSVGFDKNTNSAARMYYNQSGEWEKNEILNGSIMLRPVFSGIDDVLPISEQLKNKPLLAYPNPNGGIVFLNQKVESLFIFNLHGQKIYQKDQYTREKEAIDLQHLPAGLYIIKAKTRKGWKSVKFSLSK